MPAPDPSLAPPQRGAFLRTHRTKLLASLLVAVGLWLVLRRGGLPVVPDRHALASVRWWTCGAYPVVFTAWSFVRAMRTRHLLRPVANVPNRQVLAVSWIGFLAIFVLPFRLGEVVRPALFHQKGDVSFATAVGAAGAERIIDGLFLMVVLGAALALGHPLDPLPDHIGRLPIPVVAVPAAAYATLGAFACAFAAMAVFYWRRELARRVTAAAFGWISPRLGEAVSGQIEKLSAGFRFLPSPRHVVPYVLETALYWGLAASSMWLLAWGCGIEGMGFARSCAIMGVLGLGIIVPGAPGYFGAFQGSVYAGLALYFAEPVVLGPGAAYVFLLYVLQLGMVFVLAAVGAAIDRGKDRSAVAR
jgi:hypothetical protein